MRRCVLTVLGFCLAIWAVLPCAPAETQQGTTIAISTRSLQLNDLLDQGRQLESQRRWAEALTHYEDAIRLFPGDTGLQRRFDVVRLHYDLGRRYADRSYREMLTQDSTAKALQVYDQVLLKIQTYYVDAPRWQDFVERGTASLEAALSEPTFVDRNLPPRDRAAVGQVMLELRALLSQRTAQSRADVRDLVAAVAQFVRQKLELPATAVVMEYVCGATNALDAYSTYLTSDQLNEVYSQIEGNFVGLGVELKAQEGLLSIVRVIPGSPALEAGLRAGDQILAVDGRATRELSTDQAANMLQGEEGSIVRLSAMTPGEPARTLEIRRRRVDVPSVDQVEMRDPQYGIAYLRMTGFQKTTCRDLDNALWQMYRQGMRALIIDLRGNPGGLLVAAVDAADRFVEQGVIVSTRGRSAQEDHTYLAHAEGTWKVPLLVLIDQNSASAAEIFAGAIHDLHRGTVIGTRSFGKGSVQGIFPLEGTSAGVRLTTAKFYSPSGRPYNHLGVEPDLTVRVTAKPDESQWPRSADETLDLALQTARNLPQAR